MALSNRHRDTIEKIFDRPSSGNVEWRDVDVQLLVDLRRMLRNAGFEPVDAT